jgi:hypothetical protein
MDEVLVVSSDVKLTDELIDKIGSAEKYDAVVIRGQRPYTKDAVYLQESLNAEIIRRGPYKRDSDEEILQRLDSRKSRKASDLMTIALSVFSVPMNMNMNEYLKDLPRYNEPENP